MKKTFRFLALSLALICGTVSVWADARPTDGPVDGASVGSTVATTEGLQGVVTYVVNGWDATLNAYTVQIEGLDYDGLQTNPTTLTIQTSFVEKWKTVQYKYYVNKIIDTQGTDPSSAIPYKKAFYAKTDLTSLKFQATESAVATSDFTFSVGDYAFYGCTALTTLKFPDNVNKIGKYAFQNTAITNFVIPAECAEIGACAFNDTKKLGIVSVSEAGNDELKTIGKQVFANSFVSTLNLSNATALQSIDDQAFIFNASDVNAQLKNVTLPDVAHATNPFISLGTNGKCFANCMALEAIGNLDKSNVTAINPGAFENCVKLAELNLPATASIITNATTSPFLNTPLLKKITFADGWAGQIGQGVYASTDGNKIKYSTAEKKYVLEAYTLTDADKKKELGYLEEIEFKGKVYGQISGAAFGNATPANACSGLKKVTFAGLICQGTVIGSSAFANCAALTDLTFNGFIIENAKHNNIAIAEYAFMNTAIASVDFKGFSFYGDATVSEIAIANRAFACDQLAEVKFGGVTFYEWDNAGTATAGVAHEFKLANGTFVSDLLTKVDFGDLINDNTNGKSEGLGKISIGTDGNIATGRVFVPKTAGSTGVLEEVKIGNIVAGNTFFNTAACASEVLKSVTIGNISNVPTKTGKVIFGNFAFGYTNPIEAANRRANEKTVIIGNITGESDKMTAQINTQAFSGDLLKSVTIGNIAAKAVINNYSFAGNFAEKSVTIGNITSADFDIRSFAFAGKQLVSVVIGDIVNDAPSTAKIQTSAFANTSVNGDDFDAQEETVIIGKLANEKLEIAASAFMGPQTDGSVFKVAIFGLADDEGNLSGLEKDAKIAAGAFAGPAVGETTYVIGDINATTGIEAGAFVGSLDEEGKPATSVTVGDFNKQFPKYYTFTNVNDLTAASWNDASYISKICAPVSMTVEGDVTKNIWGDKGDDTIVSLEIGGNVISPATINDFGDKVRHIAFTAEDPEVYAGAFTTGSFEEASDAAGTTETISVIYRVKTAIKSNAIFSKKTFNDSDDGVKNVVLYTDEWSLANTFRNVEIGGSDEQVYRISLSTSAVAPGEDITATCVKGANGKYSYGRLYVPAGTGMRYKVSAEYDEATKKNGVNLFSATISGTDIYMNTVTVMEGYYWIDATETAQTLIVRTSDVSADKVTIEAEYVSEEEAQAMDAEGTVILDTDWFDATSAKKNALRYATSAITPAEFQNDATTYNKGIYVMANPANNNLAFAKYNQTNSATKDLAKGSVYVVTRSNQYARLNVIWPEGVDEESDATAIDTIENASETNDAIYNLQGVRVNKAQKGLYIINGKKVVK